MLSNDFAQFHAPVYFRHWSESAPSMERKLAAILAADVVGFSALMERDEAGTFDRLKAAARLFEPEIKKRHGRIFKADGGRAAR